MLKQKYFLLLIRSGVYKKEQMTGSFRVFLRTYETAAF